MTRLQTGCCMLADTSTEMTVELCTYQTAFMYHVLKQSLLKQISVKKTYKFITQCKGNIYVTPLKQRKSLCLTPWSAKVQMCPYKTRCCVDQCFNACDTVCAKLELQILKFGRFSIGLFIAVVKQQECAVFGCWSDAPRHTKRIIPCSKTCQKESSFWWVGNPTSVIFPSVSLSIPEHAFPVQLSTTLHSLQQYYVVKNSGWLSQGPHTRPLHCRVCRGGCYATVCRVYWIHPKSTLESRDSNFLRCKVRYMCNTSKTSLVLTNKVMDAHVEKTNKWLGTLN